MNRWCMLGTVALLAGVGGWAQDTAKPAEKPLVNPKLPKATQAALLTQKAEELQAEEKYPEAAALLQQAAELTPEDWLLWDKTGWAHLDNADAAKALKAFETAARAAPPGTVLSGGLLISNFALGRQKEVLDLVK